jgi:hypothetical protein
MLNDIPIYMAINIGMPQWWLIKGTQKICKAFLWTGTETVQNGKCLVA